MHPLHRNARLSCERPRQWPLVVAVASMVVLCVSVVALHAWAPPRTTPTPRSPSVELRHLDAGTPCPGEPSGGD